MTAKGLLCGKEVRAESCAGLWPPIHAVEVARVPNARSAVRDVCIKTSKMAGDGAFGDNAL